MDLPAEWQLAWQDLHPVLRLDSGTDDSFNDANPTLAALKILNECLFLWLSLSATIATEAVEL